MESLEKAFERLLETIFAWLPLFLGALVLLLVGIMVAGFVRRLIANFLTRFNLDQHIRTAAGGTIIQRAVPSPSSLIAGAAYWLVFLGAASLAASVLGIEALDRFIAAVYGYIPQVIAAVLIFLVASALAGGAVTLVKNTMGDTPTGKLVESIAPVMILGIATFMILNQLGIATAIVTITYAALIGSVALGSALAFGLGGQDVAARMLEDTYQKGLESKEQAKRDAKLGKERGKRHAERLKNRAS
jgi:hypothetical protein